MNSARRCGPLSSPHPPKDYLPPAADPLMSAWDGCAKASERRRKGGRACHVYQVWHGDTEQLARALAQRLLDAPVAEARAVERRSVRIAMLQVLIEQLQRTGGGWRGLASGAIASKTRGLPRRGTQRGAQARRCHAKAPQENVCQSASEPLGVILQCSSSRLQIDEDVVVDDQVEVRLWELLVQSLRDVLPDLLHA